MDRIHELVQLLEPEVPPPPADLHTRQREALLRFMARAGKGRARRANWRPRTTKSGRWFIATAGAAGMVAIIAVTLAPSSSPRRTPIVAPGTSAVLTAVTRALANTGSEIEEVQSTVPAAVHLSSASWVDLATGACRTDTSINGQPSLTVLVKDGSAVFIDYGLREWWTRGAGGITCEPPTPRTIEHDLTTGQYSLAGHSILDGQPALELVANATTEGSHPVAKRTTLWVNATNYLPIQSTSAGEVVEKTVFTWLPATSTNLAMLTVTVPAGFRQRATAPTATPSGP